MFDMIDKLKAACRCEYDDLESGDFMPEQDWEEKGITVFTDKEKGMLLKKGFSSVY